MYNLKNKRIALYGNIEFNNRTSYIKLAFESVGYHVEYIVDKKHKGFPTNRESHKVDFEKFLEAASQKKDEWIIVLCFYNVITHAKVAETLFANGYKQIVYLPFGDNITLDKSHIMRRFYNHILYGDVIEEMDLPDYEEMRKPNDVISTVIEQFHGNRGYVSVSIPMDLVHIGIEKSNVFGNVDDAYLLSMQDKHISCYESHNKLFRYVFAGAEWPELYAKHFAFGRDATTLIEEKKNLYWEMLRMTFNDPYYWLDAPIPVKWNKKGHFNVQDGHHRTSFLYNMGVKNIVAIMTEEDYGKYVRFKKGEY